MTLYISAVSFEDRCIALPTRLENIDGSDRFLLLDFLGYEDVAPYSFNRIKITRLLESKGIQPTLLKCRESEPLTVTEQIEKEILSSKPAMVVLDITVMPRNFIFTVSKCLAVLGVPTKFQYNKPKEYGNELSRGVRWIQPIAGFEGEAPANSNTILALILGFEGYKALYAWEHIGPNKVYCLLGEPPYQPKFLEISRTQNRELIEQGERIVLETIHTSDIISARDKLQSLYDRVVGESPKCTFVLCPLGTKLQSLASFGFAYRNKSVSVVYISSLNYFTEHYSRGFDPDFTEISIDQLLIE